ncbi:restriction endonuclease subunit S [Rhodococcus sp. 27YEA6]|uniref:restriction endonuclease subunit S n=1 Tax=Rhodococcus sp. 27YEA6 TaxID=3156273 RepID=UPI0038324E62
MMNDAWRATRLKYVTDVNTVVLPEQTDDNFEFVYIDIGNVTQGSMNTNDAPIRFSDAPSRARRLANPGDTVVSTVRTYLRAVATVSSHSEPLVFSTGFAVLSPRDEVHPRFLSWYLQGDEFVSRIEANSTGVSYPAITATQLTALDLRLPPYEEQRVIADYLDCEIARIDLLVQEQQCLIEMLRERRRSVASDLLGDRVGKGTRLKWLFDELDHRAGVEADRLPLMSVSISWGVRRRDEVTKEDSRAEDLSNYKICRQGDLVINRMRAFQGALGLAQENGLVSPDYAVIRAKTGVDDEWMSTVMKSDAFVSEMRQRVKGIGSTDLGNARTPRINVRDLGEIRIDLPEVEQQILEVRQQNTQTAKIDTLIAESERFVELSRERRAALITAAVTGQIDVREMV